MTGQSHLDAKAAAELHNRVANQVVSQILNETRAAGGSHSDLLVICESVLVGVIVECFKLGHDSKVIDLIFAARDGHGGGNVDARDRDGIAFNHG